jgi:nitrite reductase/ring-hydroxylating ferredoxin subunit
MSNHSYHFVYAADVKDIEAEDKCLSLSIKKHPIALFSYNSEVYALDNRCPHMGFPLSQSTLKDVSSRVTGIMHDLIFIMEEHLISGLVM